ncbi:MAG: DUF222 domain-containing protein [Microthrixaceae bacterium]
MSSTVPQATAFQATVPQATVVEEAATAAIDQIHRGITALFESGIDPADARDAEAWIRALEGIGRRVDAARSDLVGVIDRAGLHIPDGHGSAKVMVRHHAKLSEAEAKHREHTASTCRDLPELADAWRDGLLGTCHMRILGRVHANPRVAAAMETRQQRFLDDAHRLNTKMFANTAYRWARLVDQDGPEPAGERSHNNRDTKLIPDPLAGTWTLSGNFGSMQGAEMRDILDHYIDAEFRTDWETAKARLGEHVSKADLERTDAQRRADALHRLFCDAAAAPAGAVPPGFVHNIHWNADTYQETLASMAENRPARYDPDGFMCRTPDGTDVDPTEAAANSLVSQIRRIIVDAQGVVIDLGRARRFTGSARTAATAPHTTCIWPGCWLPASACEVDHLHEHATGGTTNPNNAAPLCGKHNRWKQKGFTIHRQPNGTWRLTRPDGTQVP